MKELRKLAVLLLLMLPVATAQAIPIEVSFTATNFGVGAPGSIVSGSVVYDSVSLGTPIDSLTSISLTLNGYTFSIGEVGFVSPWGANSDLIGGSLNGANAIAPGTNDFWFIYDRLNQTGSQFAYSTANSTFWSTSSFSSFSINEVGQVPEPTVLTLLSLGIIGFSFTRSKIKA